MKKQMQRKTDQNITTQPTVRFTDIFGKPRARKSGRTNEKDDGLVMETAYRAPAVWCPRHS